MVLSNIMLAHLNELLYSINLSYRAYVDEELSNDIQLKEVMVSLYEVIKNPEDSVVKQKTQRVISIIDNIIKAENLVKNSLSDFEEQDDIRFLFRRGTTFGRVQIAKNLCDVIINQRYFLQYYALEDYEANTIKTFLKAVSMFLDKFSRLNLPA